MILHLDRQPHDAVAAIDSSGHILKYSELLSFSEEINSLLPERSLLFFLTENNVGCTFRSHNGNLCARPCKHKVGTQVT